MLGRLSDEMYFLSSWLKIGWLFGDVSNWVLIRYSKMCESVLCCVNGCFFFILFGSVWCFLENVIVLNGVLLYDGGEEVNIV